MSIHLDMEVPAGKKVRRRARDSTNRSQNVADEREEHYRTLLDQAPDAVLVHQDGHLVYCNSAALRLYAADNHEHLQERGLFDLVHPDERETARARVQEVLVNGTVPLREFRHLRMDGQEVSVETNAASIMWKGRPAVQVFIRDISGRKRIEHALHESEDRYRALAQTAPDAIIVHRNDRFLYANEAALLLAGADSFEQLSSRCVRDFFLPEDRQQAIERTRMAMSRTRLPTREARLHRLDDREVLVEFHTTPIDFQGQPAIQMIARDVTERKLAESRQELTGGVLQILNRNSVDSTKAIREVLQLMRLSVGFDAVGLRIRQGDDCPYFEQNGFSDEFLREESFLCEKRGDGSIVRDENGRPVLECTCGLVLSGRTDPGMPFFTEGGSFWTNLSSELLSIPPESDPRTNPRNRCIHNGYQSVALIPVRSGEEIIGLLQLNDRRPGRLTLESVRFLEGLGDQIGLAVKRMQAEEALRRSEEQLRLFIEHSPAGIAMFDRQMRHLAVSKRWMDDRNIESQQIIGRSIYEVFPEIPDRLREVHRRCLSGAIERADEDPFVRADGKVQWMRWETRPWHSAPGQIGGIIIFSEDITARKQAEDALRESESRLARAQQIARLGSWELDLQKNHLAWSDEVYRILGLQPQEFGASYEAFLERVHPEDRAAVDAAYSGSLRAGRDIYETEHRVIRATGEIRWVHEKCQHTRDSTGRIVRSLGMVLDITERKEAEQALKRARDELQQRVNERTAELSFAIATLQDEVMQRVATENTLRERSEQLRLLASDLTRAEQRERQRLAQVLHDSLQQILVAAKYQLTGIERENDKKKTIAEVTGIIDEAIETSRSLTAELSPPILHESGLVPALEWLARWMKDRHGLIVHLTLGENPSVAEDTAIFLFQAVKELLFNIVKHAGVDSACIQLMRSDGQTQVTVEDKGTGFDQTQIRATGGNRGGFGLFRLSERLDMLGGKITIDSSPGNGTTVTLSAPESAVAAEENVLPAEDLAKIPSSISKRLRPESARAEKKIRIMLVDDHPVMRQGLRVLLGEDPTLEIVGEASDGESAISLARELKPDIILMDISMPGMNGIQATRVIHSEFPRIGIIGLSMFQEGEQAAAMREAGAVNYVTKSGPSDAVFAAIRTCAERV
jgi:PAS domain S-box-containing protein